MHVLKPRPGDPTRSSQVPGYTWHQTSTDPEMWALATLEPPGVVACVVQVGYHYRAFSAGRGWTLTQDDFSTTASLLAIPYRTLDGAIEAADRMGMEVVSREVENSIIRADL